MTPDQKLDLDNAARLQQMKINTRLTALQTALELMKTHGYAGIAGEKLSEKPAFPGQRDPVWVKPPGAVDNITLLAMAQEIEAFILGGLEKEAQEAIDNAKKPKPNIIQVRP